MGLTLVAYYCFQGVHQLGFRMLMVRRFWSNVWPSSPIRVTTARLPERTRVLRSDSRLDTCVAIVQCAVSVAASSSIGASSGTAAAVVVV